MTLDDDLGATRFASGAMAKGSETDLSADRSLSRRRRISDGSLMPICLIAVVGLMARPTASIVITRARISASSMPVPLGRPRRRAAAMSVDFDGEFWRSIMARGFRMLENESVQV